MCNGPFDFIQDVNLDGEHGLLDVVLLDEILKDVKMTKASLTLTRKASLMMTIYMCDKDWARIMPPYAHRVGGINDILKGR